MMKFLICVLVGSLVAPEATATSAALSPVSRVVELLKNLAKQAEKEGEKEEDLYETFVCWAKSVIEQKTASNAAGESRREMLETYIADLDAGRIEITSERADLEKEIEELMGDMEVAKTTRDKENADFLDAEDEMTKAISALNSAIQVLGEATEDHKKGVLIAMRSRLNGGMEALAAQQVALTHAVELGDRFLEKADSTFLHRLLLGDVPTVDWKKLNRKATFKMNYKARSFKIQDVLKKLHQTFDNNLKDATTKEGDALAQYTTLKLAKEGQLGAARAALTKMESENGAKGMSRSDSADEVEALKTQVSEDKKFISQTQGDLETKKAEWKTRSELRTGEIAAISKAVSILHSDDARDTMKRSMASQGTAFLQTGASQTANGAASALIKAAHRSGDVRLLTLAKLIKQDPTKGGHFDAVIGAIDNMVALLEGDEKTDLETKETCEADRMADTRKAILAGRDIDDKTDKARTLAEEIKTLGEQIEKLLAEHKTVQDALNAATKIREDENAAWKVTDKDDEDAAATVKNAKEVLENFYKDNMLSLAQKTAQPVVEAGLAPPPPPATWEAPYGGKTGESAGIISILDMVIGDINKDRKDANKEEDDSEAEYGDFKTKSETQMGDLMDDKNDKDLTMGRKEGELEETKGSRATKKGELAGILEKIAKINPNCEYFEVNYPMRLANRQIEIDGLNKAKAILEGGSFTENTDATREIKPGDAASANFLQINRH